MDQSGEEDFQDDLGSDLLVDAVTPSPEPLDSDQASLPVGLTCGVGGDQVTAEARGS
jgi:hypothetical protein